MKKKENLAKNLTKSNDLVSFLTSLMSELSNFSLKKIDVRFFKDCGIFVYINLDLDDFDDTRFYEFESFLWELCNFPTWHIRKEYIKLTEKFKECHIKLSILGERQ